MWLKWLNVLSSVKALWVAAWTSKKLYKYSHLFAVQICVANAITVASKNAFYLCQFWVLCLLLAQSPQGAFKVKRQGDTTEGAQVRLTVFPANLSHHLYPHHTHHLKNEFSVPVFHSDQ